MQKIGKIQFQLKVGSHDGDFSELPDFREGNSAKSGVNATARDLEKFVSSTKLNCGYYIGRYEASYRSGTTKTNYIPYCKPSTSATTDAWTNTPGRLWNRITQSDAAAACRNMYNSKLYESDLINSYAWDTTCLFIQYYSGINNYAYQKKNNNVGAPSNTGSLNDKVCNIHDMASNLFELSTEYTSYYVNSQYYHCTKRGSYYNAGNSGEYCTCARGKESALPSIACGFRPILYANV